MRTMLLVIALSCFVACKKQTEKTPELTKTVDFSTSFYEKACTWNSAGKPDCLEAPDIISADLRAFLQNNLKEASDLRTYNPGLFASTAMADISITAPSDVYVTFVSESSGATNAFAYYTFPTNLPPKSAADIKNIIYVFPSFGYGTPLKSGDKVKLGRFNTGTSIGFALLSNAWDPATNKPNNNAVHFCTNDALNPEVNPQLKKHAVLISYPPEKKTLIGFEDTNRTNPSCDHDFNDAVIYVTTTQ